MINRKITLCGTLLVAMATMGSGTALAQTVDEWVDGVHYEMNENTNGQVVVTQTKIGDGADVVLLDEITASDGVSYPVTVIGKEVFSNQDSRGIRSVKGNNITRVEQDAFVLSAIESFDFPKLTWIGGNAFSRCHDLKRWDLPSLIGTDQQIKLLTNYEFYYASFGPTVQDLSKFHIEASKLMYLACHATTPPKLSNTFWQADYSMPVHVPEQSIGAYSSAAGWKDFTNYVPLDKWQLQLLSSDKELGTCVGAGNYAPDTEVTITAVPSAIGKFKSWSDGNTENPRVITMGQDTKLTALFELDQKIPQATPTDRHTHIVTKDYKHIFIDNSNIKSIEWREASTVEQR